MRRGVENNCGGGVITMVGPDEAPGDVIRQFRVPSGRNQLSTNSGEIWVFWVHCEGCREMAVLRELSPDTPYAKYRLCASASP